MTDFRKPLKFEIIVKASTRDGLSTHTESYECDGQHLETLRKAIKGWGVTGDLVDVLTRTLNEVTPIREPQGDDE
jgi:hypothetical protein